VFRYRRVVDPLAGSQLFEHFTNISSLQLIALTLNDHRTQWVSVIIIK